MTLSCTLKRENKLSKSRGVQKQDRDRESGWLTALRLGEKGSLVTSAISWGRQSAQLCRTLMIFWWWAGFSAKQISSCLRNFRLFSKACCSSNWPKEKDSPSCSSTYSQASRIDLNELQNSCLGLCFPLMPFAKPGRGRETTLCVSVLT